MLILNLRSELQTLTHIHKLLTLAEASLLSGHLKMDRRLKGSSRYQSRHLSKTLYR